MRTVCVVIGSRANYASIKSAMRAIQAHDGLQLRVVAAASSLLDRYGEVVDVIERDGFTVDERAYMLIEGETPQTMAQSTGVGLLCLPSVFARLKPDVVITVGDRFETMATAIAASYMNIALAHTMGGEVTGTIDESIRHAVTKLAHIHFPANQDAADRIMRMGEDPATVHVVGCPRMDIVAEIAAKYAKGLQANEELIREGVGQTLDFTKPYLLVMQHPVTTEYGDGEQHIAEVLAAAASFDMQTVVMWPNADAGSEDIARGIRKYREKKKPPHMHFYKNLPPDVFIPLMMHAACMIGNSSAAIREGSFLGVPAVNVGTRQGGRQSAGNVIHADYNETDIRAAIERQLQHGRYDRTPLYGDGNAGHRIADILASCPLIVQKRIAY